MNAGIGNQMIDRLTLTGDYHTNNVATAGYGAYP
jgi:hypothetical protein